MALPARGGIIMALPPAFCDLLALLFKSITCDAVPPPPWLLTMEGMQSLPEDEADDDDDAIDEPEPAAADEDEELAAISELQAIVQGERCLAGGEHEWQYYDGNRGQGRACARCFFVQASLKDGSTENTWRISKTLEAHVPPTAIAVLSAWREEARRCRDGGCIAGGEHVWVDATKTVLRLASSKAANCCEKCGRVEVRHTGECVVLPNLLGQFGGMVRPTEDMYERAGVMNGSRTHWRRARRSCARYTPAPSSNALMVVVMVLVMVVKCCLRGWTICRAPPSNGI